MAAPSSLHAGGTDVFAVPGDVVNPKGLDALRKHTHVSATLERVLMSLDASQKHLGAVLTHYDYQSIRKSESPRDYVSRRLNEVAHAIEAQTPEDRSPLEWHNTVPPILDVWFAIPRGRVGFSVSAQKTLWETWRICVRGKARRPDGKKLWSVFRPADRGFSQLPELFAHFSAAEQALAADFPGRHTSESS